MPITVSVKSDLDRFNKALDDFAVTQLPFATVLALNDTAREAAGAVRRALPAIFDRPVAYTLNSVATRTATKQTLASEVFIKDRQAKYLLHEEEGGARTPGENVNKPGAQALIIPSKIKLNDFGNIPNGAIKRLILADAQRALSTKQSVRKFGGVLGGYETTRSKRDKGYFYLAGHGLKGEGPGGIFKRLPGHHVSRLISFAGEAHYHARFHFRARVERAARATFRVALMRRLRELRGK